MQDIEDLFMQYKKDIFHYLLSLTCNPLLAEDLLSETFLRALQSLGRFKGESSIKTWLLGIARNVWLQSLRKRSAPVEFTGLLEHYVKEDDSLSHACSTDMATYIKQLLSQKSEKVQQILYMRIKGYSQQEIATECGISANSVRVIEFRTKKWLRENLQKEGYIE